MSTDDAPAVSAMMYASFRESMAAGHSDEAQLEFFEYAAADRLVERVREGHQIIVALLDNQVTGAIETSPPSHIAHLFVDTHFQGQGIAGALLDAAFPASLTAKGLNVTVNAPPEAITSYGRLGFRVIAAEQMRNGIRFVPMIRTYGPMFFPVGIPKFVIMSLCTFGIYPIWWIYLNWRYERDRTGDSISPFWRACFAPLFLHSLFHRVRRAAGQVGVPAPWSVGFLTLATIAIWVTVVLLAQPWALLSLFGFVPSIPVQQTVNGINQRVAAGSPRNTGLTTWNVVAVVVGTLVYAVLIWGLVAGVPETRPGAVAV
jgi:GNAT superfamily N-acetyltransferase